MGRLRPPRRPATTPLSAADLDQLWVGCTAAFKAAQADGSRDNVSGTGRLYAQFCEMAGFPAFPVTMRGICNYLVDYVHRGNSPESLSGVVSRLKRFTLEQGYEWLTEGQQFYVANVRQGLRRLFKEPVVRAAPCTVAILNNLAAAADPQDPLDFMVLTMCFVAHNGLLRGGELLQLTVGDLRWDTPDRTACSLRIGTSKANQFGAPEWVPYEDFGDNSAAAFLRDYVARFALDGRATQTPLFPAFPQVASCPAALSHAAFTRHFRRLLDRAGLPPAGYTGHSFRSGGATDLFNGECRPHTIRLQGRWLSDAVWIYVRDCPEHRRREVAAALRKVSHLFG